MDLPISLSYSSYSFYLFTYSLLLFSYSFYLFTGWKDHFKSFEVFVETPEATHPILQYVTLIEMVKDKVQFSSPEVLKRIEHDCEAEEKEKDMQIGSCKEMILKAFLDIDDQFNEYLIDIMLDNQEEEAKLRYPTYGNLNKDIKED